MFSAFKRSESVKALNLRTWPIQDPEADSFPEQANGMVSIDENSVGVAMSGGGSRSHTLCAGYLRALHHLDHQKDISYISAVSGGSWASSVYTFANEDDDILLGQSTPPSMCNIENLQNGDPGKLAKVVSEKFHVFSTMSQYFTGRIRAGDVWQRMIGKSVLADFGLEGKVMAANEKHRSEILERNVGNKAVEKRSNDIVIPKAGRPFLIMNAAMGGPDGYTSGWGNSLQFTPLYSGVPFYRRNRKMPFLKWTVRCKLRSWKDAALGSNDPQKLVELYNQQFIKGNDEGALELTVGGGVIESFAFGTESLDDEESYFGAQENARGKLGSSDLFMIEDAVGASSAAFVAAFQNLDLGMDFTPDANYFPILSKDLEQFSKPEAPEEMRLADGGNYENTGILPLLQRGLKKVVCFINSAQPLDRNFIVGKFNNEAELLNGESKSEEKSNVSNGSEPYYCADTQLLALFDGINLMDFASNYTSSTVFEKEKLNDVMLGLLSNLAKGKGAVTKQTLKLLRNDDWNIIGGYDVEVLFVYNERCDNFVRQLPDQTKQVLAKEDSPFGDFPFYRTMFQNMAPFSLELQEVNLLSAQAEFVVKQNKELFAEIFGSSKKA